VVSWAMRRASAIMLVAVLLQACTRFDPLDQRSETVNRNATDYANDATLLNVVRASLSEPLAFVTITGLQRHAKRHSVRWSAVGHFRAERENTYTFGPNSIGRTNSSIVSMSVVDDSEIFCSSPCAVDPCLACHF
jgi:hypothetical protein